MPRSHRLAVRATLLALLVVASTAIAGVSLATAGPTDPGDSPPTAVTPVTDSTLVSELVGNQVSNIKESDDSTFVSKSLQTDLSDGERTRALVIFEDQPDVAKLKQQTSSRTELVNALKQTTKQSQAESLSTATQLEASGEISSFNRYWLINAIAINGTQNAIEEFKNDPNVAAIVADERVRIPQRARVNTDSNEPLGLSTQSVASVSPTGHAGSSPDDNDSVAWGVERINADDANDLGYTGEGVRVAVIDTGVDQTHPDLKDKVVAWKDFVHDLSEPYDDNGHGTHVAGTVAGDGDGGIQTGVAPQADIIGAKALDSQGGGFISDIIQAVQWSVAQDADVISMSLGGPENPVFTTVMEQAAAAGSIPVISSGNLPSTKDLTVNAADVLEVGYPGDEDAVITVGATNPQERRAYFSAYQSDSGDDVKPEVVAPGVDVESALTTYYNPRETYTKLSGTSMAAPHVSGLAALVLAENPDMSVGQFETLLKQTSTDLGPRGTDDKHGFGRVNAKAALAAAGETKSVTTDITVEENDTLNISVSVTDARGNSLVGETVNVTGYAASPEVLEIAKQDNKSYLFEKSIQTDRNGTASVTVENATNLTRESGGEFSVEAAVNGGLWSDVDTADLGKDVQVDVTADASSYESGENATLTVTTTENGSAVNATVDVQLVGPTGQVTSDLVDRFQTTVTTGADGTATAELDLPDGFVQNIVPEGYVPGYGQYDAQLTTTSVNGTDVARETYTSGVFDFGIKYTDVSFGTPQNPNRALAYSMFQYAVVSERADIGSQKTVELNTTNPNTDYKVQLFKGVKQGFGNDINFSKADVSRTLGTVTTDSGGDAAMDVTIPEDLPSGEYLLVASTADTDLSKISTIPETVHSGSIDMGRFYVEAMEVDVEFIRPDARDDTLQVGDTVEIRVEYRNASTGKLTDPKTANFASEALNTKQFTHVATGVYQSKGAVVDPSASVNYNARPTVTTYGTDQNNGTFGEPSSFAPEGPSESAMAAYHETHVSYNTTDIEPGDSVKLTFHVSDRQTGEPVENAEISALTAGFNKRTTPYDFFFDTWQSSTTATTDEHGQASIVFNVPPGASEHTALWDIITQYKVTKGDSVTRQLRTATELNHPSTRAGFPKIDVSLENSTQLQGTGPAQSGVLSGYEPGETVTVSVDVKGAQLDDIPASSRRLDVYVGKVSDNGFKVGSNTVDYLESKSTVMQVDENGHGTFTYTVPEHANPGILTVSVSGRFEGVGTLGGSAGALVADDLSISGPDAAKAGEDVSFTASGEFEPSTDVEFIIRKKTAHTTALPQLSRSGTGTSLNQYLNLTKQYNEKALNISESFINALPADAVANKKQLATELAGPTAQLLMQSDAPNINSVSTASASGAGSTDALSTNISLPDNMPAGEYEIVAIATSDQGDAETRGYGSKTITVHSKDRETVTRTQSLEKGWNLVSLPVNTELSVSNLQNQTDGSVMKAVTMVDGDYQTVESITDDRAYWVFATEDASVDVTGVKIDERTYDVDSDWQLVGGLSDAASLAEGFVSPDDLQIQAVTWDASAGEYVTVEKMTPGEGYWLVANEDGSVTLMTPPSSPSSSDTANETAT
jgi:subtilisin family serine protease